MSGEKFGNYLRTLRKERGLTVKKVADLSDVSQSYITNVENNKRGTPSPDILKKLAEPLGVTYAELMVKAGYVKFEDLNDTLSDGSKEYHDYEKVFEEMKEYKAARKKEWQYRDWITESLKYFILLFDIEVDRPFVGKIKEEFLNKLDEFTLKHGVTIGEIDANSPTMYEQIADAVNDTYNISFQLELLEELKKIANKYHLWGNPTFDYPSSLEDFLQQPNITYNNHAFTEQDKKLTVNFLDVLFSERTKNE